MALSLNDYIDFISLANSLWGWLALSLLFIAIAQFRPFMALALMCFYPTIPWSASWKPIVTLYPIYPLIFFLYIKYLRQIVKAVFEFRYRTVILLSALIIVWSFLSPVLYPASYGPPFEFTLNPNYQRGVLLLAVLILTPAVLRSRDDIRRFLLSTGHLFIVMHLLILVASISFLLLGHSLYNLHLMRILETPPVYWESGLLLLCLGYFFVRHEMSFSLLIIYGTLAFACILLGNSRTRFLATAICLLYFMYPYVSKRMFAWIVSLALMLSVSLLLLPHNVENYFSRMINQRIEQSTSNDLSKVTSGRTIAFEFAYKRWTENPFIGVGSCYILPRTATDSLPRVHNYFLEVLAGQGAVGFGLLIIVLGISFIMILKIGMIKADKAVEGRIIVALFLFGIINWLLKESWGITYSTIAMLSVYTQTRESEPSKCSDR